MKSLSRLSTIILVAYIPVSCGGGPSTHLYKGACFSGEASLPPSVAEGRREAAARFAVALGFYRRGEFDAAHPPFASLRARGDDSVVDTFLNRCDDFMRQPSTPDRDGIFDATSKQSTGQGDSPGLPSSAGPERA